MQTQIIKQKHAPKHMVVINTSNFNLATSKNGVDRTWLWLTQSTSFSLTCLISADLLYVSPFTNFA